MDQTNAQSSPLSEQLQKTLTDALALLAELKEELKSRQAGILEKTDTLKKQVDELNTLTGARETELSDMFEKTSKDYQQLVDNTMQEVDYYTAFYQAYLQAPSDEIVKLATTAPERLQTHIDNEVKLLKSFVKKRRKDFSVIFSRFDHGYTTHFARLKAIRQHIEHQRKQSAK